MAGTRVHKLGSIFERVSGLLESGMYKAADKPIWFDVYRQHPPKYCPRFDREAPDVEVKNIHYEEDIIRAKIHKAVRMKSYDLNSKSGTSMTKDLIKSCGQIMNAKGVSLDEAIKMLKVSSRHDKKMKAKGQENEDLNYVTDTLTQAEEQ